MIPIDQPLASWVLLFARICLSLVFLFSCVHKTIWYQSAVDEFRMANVPIINVTLPATIALQFGGSIGLVFGLYVTEFALALALFTLLATERAHGFWRFAGADRLERGRTALANLAVIGGLLVLSVSGPGHLALTP
jgi:putative oxidoreductase